MKSTGECCSNYNRLNLNQVANHHYQDPRYYCYNCSHTNGFHDNNSYCTTMVETRKEWYILGNVKLAEAIVPEPCKCKKFIAKQKAIIGYYDAK
jgi:hypothetical protein